jgi:LuxR family maltose regulon positive regulatory protein
VLSATALLWLNRCGEARRTLDEVWADFDTVLVRIMAAGVLAVACVETGDLERAERVARHAIQLSEDHHTGPSPEMVSVHLALGSVLTQRGDLEAADVHLARGVELARWWTAPAQVAYGRLLQAQLRARQGDRDGGLQRLREAAPTVESARDRGLLAAALRRAEQALRRPQARSPRGSAVELTERELDVLRLLPSHLSAREIGRELNVSLNTTKTHIRNLYLKLGVSSRADAVERARELYLL